MGIDGKLSGLPPAVFDGVGSAYRHFWSMLADKPFMAGLTEGKQESITGK
jgi:hypothetical protein